jgi:MSHA biogenesis protein MshL
MKRRILVTLVALLVLSLPARGAVQDDTTITLVTSDWVDVRDILSNVAQSADLGLQMAPDASGKVNVHLENVSVTAALDAILEPIHLGYEIIDGILIIYKRSLVTRWFDFNYPVTVREGRGELMISAGSTGGGGSSGGGGGSSGGGGSGGSQENQSHVTSKATMSIWPMIVGSLTTLVFQGTEPYGGSVDEEGMSVSLSDSEGRSLVVNAMAGIIQVTAEWDRMNRCEGLLQRMEASLLRQVAIEVKIFEVNLTDEHKTGIDWSAIADPDYDLSFQNAPELDPALSFVVDTKDLYLVFDIIQEQGSIKVLSSPQITTLNNQKAVVRIVREEVFYAAEVQPAIIANGVASEAIVAYTPLVYPIGVVLDVTPQIGGDRTVTLNVHPTITNVVDVVFSPNLDSQPVVAVRELDTVGTVRSGQTLVIAGLMSEFFDEQESGVPLLKDIPLLGYLFKNTKKLQRNIELVMLLTPTIMDEKILQDRAEEAELLIEDNM